MSLYLIIEANPKAKSLGFSFSSFLEQYIIYYLVTSRKHTQLASYDGKDRGTEEPCYTFHCLDEKCQMLKITSHNYVLNPRTKIMKLL